MDKDTACETFFEKYHELTYDILREYKIKQDTNEHQDWELLKLSDLKLLWEEYMRTGLVFKRKLFEKVENTVINNVIKLKINTELCGHTQLDPKELIDDCYGDEEDSGIDINKNDNFFIDPACGQYRISDYAMDKLEEKVLELFLADTEEKKIVIIDQVLNICHRRSDLSTWFVEGGARSLDELSGKTKDENEEEIVCVKTDAGMKPQPGKYIVHNRRKQ